MGLYFDMSGIEYAPSWLLCMLETDKVDNLIKIATVHRGIWIVRNKKLWEEKVVSLVMELEWSSKHISDWRNVVSRVQGMKLGSKITDQTRQQCEHRWKPPLPRQLKINVDASVFPGSNSFSIGWILRDSTGPFVRGKTMWECFGI